MAAEIYRIDPKKAVDKIPEIIDAIKDYNSGNHDNHYASVKDVVEFFSKMKDLDYKKIEDVLVDLPQAVRAYDFSPVIFILCGVLSLFTIYLIFVCLRQLYRERKKRQYSEPKTKMRRTE